MCISAFICVSCGFFWPFSFCLIFLFYPVQIGFCCDFVVSLVYLIIFYSYPLEAHSFLIGDGKQVNPTRRISGEELGGVGGEEIIITICSLKKSCNKIKSAAMNSHIKHSAET